MSVFSKHLFRQAVNEYDVTVFVLRNYKLAIWMPENNNGSSYAHLLLLTVDTHMFAVLYIFLVFTDGLMVTDKGGSTSYLQLIIHNCTIQCTEQ
jgi:hypothetical protein